MKWIWKIIGIVAAILLVLGVVLIMAAVFTGGSLEGIRNNVALMDYEQSFDGAEITALILDFDAGKLKVLPGETLRVEAKNVLDREFVCSLEDGVLKVRERWSTSWADGLSRLLTLRQKDTEVTVYLPEGVELLEADIDISAGLADIRGVHAQRLTLDMSAGRVNLEDLKTRSCAVDMSAGKLDVRGLQAEETRLDSSAGDIAIAELDTQRLTLDISAGATRISGAISEYCYVDMSAGTVKMNLTGTADDYTARLSRSAGSISYDGRSYTGDAYVGKGAGRMDLSCSAGSIDVRFAG